MTDPQLPGRGSLGDQLQAAGPTGGERSVGVISWGLEHSVVVPGIEIEPSAPSAEPDLETARKVW
ncbi:MAG: hypothetical protein ACR2IP_06355, partial [Solirubrobacteraceae bacterium]